MTRMRTGYTKEVTWNNISVNLGAICMGITIGWTEPALFYFTLPKETYEELMPDVTILSSIMNLGTSVGVIIPMCLVDTIGRKKVFGISGAVNTASWMILTIPDSESIIIIAAFVGGMATGIYFTTMALYVTEISLPTNRGIVGALVFLCTYTGVLLISCMAMFSIIRIFTYIMCIISFTFLISTSLWMIESPYFLYQRGKILEVKKCLKALRGKRTVLEIEEEFKSIIRFLNKDQDSSPETTLLQALKPKAVKKSVAIVIPILCVSQMVGGHAMDTYTEEVIDNLIPHYGRILLSWLNVVSVAVCLYIIEKVGRKPLLKISIFGSTFCCFTLGVYRFVMQQQCQQTNIENWILPVTVLTIYYAVYSLGLIPVLPIFTGEIFPSRVKTTAISCCIIFVHLVAVAMQTAYESLNDKNGACVAFVVFMLLGSLGLPLTITFFPETKGKSLYQIQDELEDVVVVI